MSMSEPQASQPHKPADDQEHVYFEGPPLLRGESGRLIGFVLLGLIVIGGSITAGVMVFPPAFGGVVVGLALMFIPWIYNKAVRYRITNYRIDFERGLLSKKIDTLELWHVDDIQFSQSVLERLLRVGTITIMSNDDTTPKLVLSGLPSPRPLFDSLKQRVIAVKRQRGVIKMDLG